MMYNSQKSPLTVISLAQEGKIFFIHPVNLYSYMDSAKLMRPERERKTGGECQTVRETKAERTAEA